MSSHHEPADMVRTELPGGKLTLSSSTPRDKAVTSTRPQVHPRPRPAEYTPLALPDPPSAPEKAARCRKQPGPYLFGPDATSFRKTTDEWTTRPFTIHTWPSVLYAVLQLARAFVITYILPVRHGGFLFSEEFRFASWKGRAK